MKPLIQVCGDPTVDWIRIHNKDSMVRGGVYYWKQQEGDTKVRLSSKPGGSAMVLDFLSTLIPPTIATVKGATLENELLEQPKNNRITTSWTSWRTFTNPGMEQPAYRLEKWYEFEPGHWDYLSGRLRGYPNLLLVLDSDLGFRNAKAGWPEALSATASEQPLQAIIYKLGQYYEEPKNPLLDQIINLGLAEKTTIVTTLSDLRSCAVKIGVSLSWEQMFEEVVAAVFNPNCPFVSDQGKKLKYRRVIVTMGASGAIVIENNKSSLIFERSGQEGDFAGRFPGQVMGYHTCLLGALTATWVADPQHMDWVKATCKGIKLARTLHLQGYKAVKQNHSFYLAFPNQAMSAAYHQLECALEKTKPPIEDQVNDLGIFTCENAGFFQKDGQKHWTILEESLLLKKGYRDCLHDAESGVIACARNIVLKGPLSSLPNVPVAIFGAWSSADRLEIEGVRSVNNAMQDYLQLKHPEQPLSVAVFGPPGAGKSFVVKEIARGLGIPENAQLTFNLSQFASPEELLTAFDEIRDLNLRGIMPLVFWDEFDTPYAGQHLGWLRYFLAPMQDGKFTDHGVARPLGGGIYVFAGATSHSFAQFEAGDTPEDRAAKKPDFISRLRAFINIQGINGNPNTIEDRLYMIRRAFILRQYLELYAPQILHNGDLAIEPGVLDAFLRASKYTHGARSLENLVLMSSLRDKRKFELSSLPPDNIIRLHANVKEFKALACMENRGILRIGIAGHHHLIPAQIEKLEQAVDEVITFIEKRFPQHYLTVFSPLAAGADRFVARRLLNREATRLIAILPLAPEAYLHEFGPTDDFRQDSYGAELRQELKYWLSEKAIEIIEMPPAPTRNAAYLKVGHFIAENSDLLIVLWDEQTPEKDPYTPQVVERAQELHKPICHIWADTPDSRSPKPKLDIRCGKIEYKNFAR